MKIIALIFTLSLLASCGKNHSQNSNSTSGTEELTSDNGTPYMMPKIGYHKEVELNYHLESNYEFLSFNPNGKHQVLGDRPFYIFLDENNGISLGFYHSHTLRNVGYVQLERNFDMNSAESVSEWIMNYKMATPVDDFVRSFTYGKKNLVSPEQDMLNKVFVIETQESDAPYISTSKIMFWVVCKDGFEQKTRKDYSCPEGNLRFHYKLLDYKLEKQKEE